MHDLSAEITELTCAVLDKRIAETLVIVTPVPHTHWFIGKRSLVELGQNSFRLEVTVSDETNTHAQKKAFQRAAYDLLAARIGNVHLHANVRIIDCRPGAYGYGGTTQAARMEAAPVPVADRAACETP
ncbi:hypothetical protein [Salinisphaera sp. Q1T1-3]|uniref:tautomerase family protein n=1 Tax=Salinisphaera sp. Q1T1-3 TaxID=2321229 RepID=UPI0018F5E321|nr:hypothetical protein [Salinisphaera sp. Q1T1-3]